MNRPGRRAGVRRVLLLGGAGFLGGHVASALLRAGHAVCVLSRGRRPPPPGVEALIADRRDPRALQSALGGRRFDATVDFTAFEAEDIERLAPATGALGRWIMISSGQVYLVTRCDRVPYREEDSEQAVIPEPADGTADQREWRYGVGKRRAEQALLALHDSLGVPVIVLRPPVMLGEGDATLRLWAYLERLLDGGPIVLPDGGRRALRFLYAGDLAKAALRLIEGEAPPRRVYNLAQPDVVTLRELLERLAGLAGAAPRWVEAGWEAIEREGLERSFSPFAGPWVSVLDPGRAAADWGWTGSPLTEYLPRVVRWTLDHRPAGSHPGYAQRAREIALASGLAAGRGGPGGEI